MGTFVHISGLVNEDWLTPSTGSRVMKIYLLQPSSDIHCVEPSLQVDTQMSAIICCYLIQDAPQISNV